MSGLIGTVKIKEVIMKKLIVCIAGILVSGMVNAAVMNEEITYTAGDTTLKGYVAYDDAIEGKRPGVLVVHEWWGLNEYARMRADMLAEQGYVALAIDMYGNGQTVETPDEAGGLSKTIYGDWNLGKERFMAGLEALGQSALYDGENVGAVGYCFGGGVLLHMARMGVDLDAVVSLHGSLKTQIPAKVDTVTSKILVLHGNADPLVPQEDVDAFKTEMDAADVDYIFVGYDGATHAFSNPKATEVGEQYGLPVKYDEAADKDSWNKMVEFLDEILK